MSFPKQSIALIAGSLYASGCLKVKYSTEKKKKKGNQGRRQSVYGSSSTNQSFSPTFHRTFAEYKWWLNLAFMPRTTSLMKLWSVLIGFFHRQDNNLPCFFFSFFFLNCAANIIYAKWYFRHHSTVVSLDRQRIIVELALVSMCWQSTRAYCIFSAVITSSHLNL